MLVIVVVQTKTILIGCWNFVSNRAKPLSFLATGFLGNPVAFFDYVAQLKNRPSCEGRLIRFFVYELFTVLRLQQFDQLQT